MAAHSSLSRLRDGLYEVVTDDTYLLRVQDQHAHRVSEREALACLG